MINKWTIGFLALVALIVLFRKPIMAKYFAFTTGAQAAQDAQTQTGYTTYNQTLYNNLFLLSSKQTQRLFPGAARNRTAAARQPIAFKGKAAIAWQRLKKRSPPLPPR